MTTTSNAPLTKKDFKSDQDVRWCPGCGDYGILNAVQSAFAKMGKNLHDTVVIYPLVDSALSFNGTRGDKGQ